MAGLWKVIALGAGVFGAKYARNALDGAWRKTVGGDPPKNPASHDTRLSEAIAYGAVSGAAVGLARMFAQRGAAGAWHKATGAYPPGLEEAS